MGSKDRIPLPHLSRPPPDPGMVHPDPFGPGIHSTPGPFAHPNMLPSPEIMEQKLAAQHLEMQRLATENQRLAATHGTLRQELAAAQHWLQILHAQIGAVNSEKEQQMMSLKDTIAKMEADLKAAEPVKLELQQAHAEARNVVLARDELMSKIHQLNLDLQRVHVVVQQIPALMSELESLRQEYHQCRATFDCGKQFYNNHFESLQVMENSYMTMARELEKLRAELTNVSSVAGNNESEASGHGMGHILFEEGYGVHQGHGSVPAVAVAVGTAAYVGAQSGSVPGPARAGYEALTQPACEPSKGLGFDAARAPSYYPQRGPSYDSQR